MSEALAFLPWPHAARAGPVDVGAEQRWEITADDGRRLVVAQLAADLARDESIRRRWVRDAERIKGLGVHSIVPVIALGPEPDPRSPSADPPWRVRNDPDGEPLTVWLQRAPVTIEEFTGLFAALADALQAVHAAGAVLRDLRPEQVIRTSDGRVLLADVGLSRVDILSSHTASSLLLQGSSYAAPEQVATTAVDLRSDLFSLGVMMWQALTGELPFGDEPAFLRRESDVPDLHVARPDVPPAVALVVQRCLAIAPTKRPPTAMAVALVLRGGSATSLQEQAMTTCQHCQSKLRVGQRLCLECGRLAVKFVQAQPGQESFGLDLRVLGEDARQQRWLQQMLVDVSATPMPRPEFLVGAVHLYSNEEKARRIRLPARLYNNLSEESARQLQGMMAEQGFASEVVCKKDVSRRTTKLATIMGVGLALATVAGVALIGVWMALATLGFALAGGLILVSDRSSRKNWVERTAARFRLRETPAALPASDPLVAKLAALLEPETDDDVRAVVGEMALLVQRLVDHRATFVHDASELELVISPLSGLVDLVEAHVKLLVTIGAELSELDEGRMVRALAGVQAREEGTAARAPILMRLDQMRAFEDQRAAAFQRLLETQSLLSRTVELGLQQHDAAQEHDRQVALAVSTLMGT